MVVRTAVRTAAIQVTHGLDFWFGIRKLATQTRNYIYVYGFSGLFLPYILSYDVYGLVQSVLRGADDDDLIRTFCDNQVKETSVVAMIGSVIAGNAVAALGKPLMPAAPWPAAAFLHASLVAALFCIYHSMRLNRIVGGLNTPDAIKDWLRSPPNRIRCSDKNRPSISAVLILDTPRTLVTIASVGFVLGWSIYVFFVYIWNLDHVAGQENSMNIMIFYGVSLWIAIAIYLKADIFNYYNDSDQTWASIQEMFSAIGSLFTGRPTEYDEEDSYPTTPGPRMNLRIRPHAVAHHTSQMNEMGHVDVNTPSERSEGSERKSLGNALLAEALRESIDARKRAIESDEQFVRALQMYHPDMHSSYNS